MLGIVKKIFGDQNEKEIKALRSVVEKTNSLEPEFQNLDAEQIHARTAQFRERLAKGESPDDLLPEAFAAVREAAKRTLGQRHYDVQLMGGAVLHQGKIAEMQTGEGKTLVATLPVSLNALTGQGVHVVTVNDYLARRDTQWMGPVYRMLGLSVGCLQHETSYLYDPEQGEKEGSLKGLVAVPRRLAYQADITYGTNNEFGFDYLRDNMAAELAHKVQRGHNYVIVDEVDNILIDEARTPLIISGPAAESTQVYHTFSRLAPQLKEGADFTIDEKMRAISITEDGISKVERLLNVVNLYDPANYHMAHYLENAVRAHALYKLDRDYVVKNGEVIIVDEFTGRLMPGRRWSDGLHQAVEAKEGVKVQQETITWATITIQNYFRMYKKLAGMTGTAFTEQEEFWKIYHLPVVVVPTHRPMIRVAMPDKVFKSQDGKWTAVTQEIADLSGKGQPVLVGTTSIETSEKLSELLRKKGVAHQVLNAKFHEKEAGIIAQAGRLGAVTVATNMAGRGTDIILGGNPADRDPAEWETEHKKVVELGGLHVLGTERHEARRIDNQLRGRAGRQGDPGSSQFFVSLDDDLMRRFGGDRIKGIMDWAGLEEDVPIENNLVSKSIEQAQIRTEGYHFDIRKHLVEYDDVVNNQRVVIYGERNKLLAGADLKANVREMVHRDIKALVALHLQGEEAEKWTLDELAKAVRAIYPLPEKFGAEALSKMSRAEVEELLLGQADAAYEQRETELGSESMRVVERLVMLRAIDVHWVEHLTAMENMRQGIGLEAVGQRDPLVMYRRQGAEMFMETQERIARDIVRTIYHVQLQTPGQPPAQQAAPQRQSAAAPARQAARAPAGVAAAPRPGGPMAVRKVGRNDPCPCGSGKKYKKCHGT